MKRIFTMILLILLTSSSKGQLVGKNESAELLTTILSDTAMCELMKYSTVGPEYQIRLFDRTDNFEKRYLVVHPQMDSSYAVQLNVVDWKTVDHTLYLGSFRDVVITNYEKKSNESVSIVLFIREFIPDNCGSRWTYLKYSVVLRDGKWKCELEGFESSE